MENNTERKKKLEYQKQILQEQLNTNHWQGEFYRANLNTVEANRRIIELSLRGVQNDLDAENATTIEPQSNEDEEYGTFAQNIMDA